MSFSTNGILAYGYDLGGDEGAWLVKEVEDYSLTVDWWGDNGDGFQEAAEERLLSSAGFTETDYMAEGYFKRAREAWEALGVEFEVYCSAECPMYVLAAKDSVKTAYRGDCEVADFEVKPEWRDKLRNALEVLGLTPTQERAQWLLFSYYSG